MCILSVTASANCASIAGPVIGFITSSVERS
jgi:hypothetical protein